MVLGASLALIASGSVWATNGNSPSPHADMIQSIMQQKTIKGTVVDETGEPIIGANVVEKGTTNGVITDFNGEFTLNVPLNSTVQISYIGYNTQEVKITSTTQTLNIKMVEDSETLDEVVVVGYGVQKKANLTGAVASVDFEEQAKSRPVTTVSAALAGLSAGVQVMQSSGQPGSDGATIRIRGVGTLNNADPLVLIDGLEGSMDNVNAQDIETISILKDAASCAIYGSRAANGVILITTKKGKGRISINYSGRVSYAQPTRIIDMVSNYADYMEWINESGENIGQKGNFDQTTIDLWREKAKDPNGVNENGVPNYVAYPNTDWQKEIFKHGLINDHNLSLSGGTDKTRFLASLGYMDNPGLVDRTGVKQYKMRVNLEADVTKWLTAGARIYGDMKDQEVGNFSNANNYLRQTTPGVYPEWNGQYGYPEAPEESATANNLLQKLNDTNGSTKKTNEDEDADHEDVHDHEDEDTHDESSHDHAHESHGEQDEHVWTSPKNAMRIVQKLCDSLCRLDPEHADEYQANTASYLASLASLDEEFSDVTAIASRHTIVFGDRFPFRYFADTYGLDYYAAFPGCSSESEASAKTLSFLIDKIKEEQIPVVFHTELSNEQMTDSICEATGAKKLLLHSCHNVSKDDFESGATYLSLMEQNVSALKEALN